MTTRYTKFGKTKLVPLRVVQNMVEVEGDEYDTTLWVEDNTDEYALMSSGLRPKRVLVVYRNEWLRADEV